MARVFVTMVNYLHCTPGCGRDNRRTVPTISPRQLSEKLGLSPISSDREERYMCPMCGEDEILVGHLRIHIF